MKVMVIAKATAASEAGARPSQERMAAMGRYNEALVNAGVMLAGEGLKPSSQGARIHIDGARREVVDGPFAGTGELVAGFWLWQVRSMEEAIEWARRCPDPHPGSGGMALEIRPLSEPENFGGAFTPELREQQDRLRERIAGERWS